MGLHENSGIGKLALLWSKKIDRVEYQVRSAGQTRRLYTNGVFHSQFNPANAFSGALWDMLSLPAVMLPQQPGRSAVPRVLVLGVGGGAVMRQLRHLLPQPRITGVDIDAIHLKIARRWFGVTSRYDNLVHAEARDWLGHYTGEPFDLVIDDLFGETGGEPVRAVAHNREWCSLLLANLAPGGLIVANFIDRPTLNASDLVGRKKIHSAACLQHRQYHNHVGLFFGRSWAPQEWRKQIHLQNTLTATQRRAALALRLSRIDVGR